MFILFQNRIAVLILKTDSKVTVVVDLRLIPVVHVGHTIRKP